MQSVAARLWGRTVQRAVATAVHADARSLPVAARAGACGLLRLSVPTRPVAGAQSFWASARAMGPASHTKGNEDQAEGEAAAEPMVLVQRASADEGIATVTLNRPGARNALSMPLMRAVRKTLQEVSDDPGTRVVVLAANGPAFSAGHDLKELASSSKAELANIFAEAGRLCLDIQRLRQPVIAQVHALATAAGCQVVASCDLVVAADMAKFATPGVHVGIFCSTPAVALGRAVSTKTAMEMLLTGAPLSAQEARECGLINRVVPSSDLESEVKALASVIASKSPAVIALGKAGFYRQLSLGVDDAYNIATAVMTTNLTEVADAQEGLDAFLSKRHPQWEGR